MLPRHFVCFSYSGISKELNNILTKTKNHQLEQIIRNSASLSLAKQHHQPKQLIIRNSASLSTPKNETIEDIKIVNGLPHITVPLPSRNEKCLFALKPISNCIGDFLNMLKHEDKGIDRAIIKTPEGVRISSTTSIQTLFEQEFDLYINDTVFRVFPPQLEGLSKEELKKISDVKHLVSQLYEALNIDEHQLAKEKELLKELEVLKTDLKPLEDQHQEITVHAERRSNLLTWAGLGLMSVQFGVLARLTWWEYSWDIMEPVTYFVTYGTAMACYAYFVLTRQDYLLPDVKNRQHLLTFHKKAKKHRWDVDRYNTIKEGINSVEGDLRRLRYTENQTDSHSSEESIKIQTSQSP